MKELLLLLFVVLYSALVLTACQTTPAQPGQGMALEAIQPEQVMTLEEFFAPASDKVHSIADNILVKGVRTKFVRGLMKADFKLLNNRGRRNVFSYRVQWLDNSGMLASPYEEWLTIDLEGQQEMIVSVISPTAQAVDYRLELKNN